MKISRKKAGIVRLSLNIFICMVIFFLLAGCDKDRGEIARIEKIVARDNKLEIFCDTPPFPVQAMEEKVYMEGF